MFYGFFAVWEPLAFEAAPPFLKPFVADRARLDLLRADLGDLDCSLPATVAEDVPAMATIAALLGSMYVLEGSRLGGQTLVRSLAPRLDLSPERGLRFFYGFGPQTGTQWKLFCARVEELVDPADAPQAVAAARATFLAMHTWITASGITAPAGISVRDR